MDLHDGSADERNANHEGPARNSGENPKEVSNRLGDAILGQRAIEWVEGTLIRSSLLPRLSEMNLSEGLDVGGRDIHWEDPDIDRRRLGGCVEYPEAWGTGSPAVTEYRLVVAVQVGKVWRIGIGCK